MSSNNDNEVYNRIFHKIPMGFAIFKVIRDEDGNPVDFIFSDANIALEKITSKSTKSVLGQKVTALLSEENAAIWNNTLAQADAAEKPVKIEVYLESPIYKYLSVNAFSVGDDIVAAYYEDITREKRLESALSLERSHINL